VKRVMTTRRPRNPRRASARGNGDDTSEPRAASPSLRDLVHDLSDGYVAPELLDEYADMLSKTLLRRFRVVKVRTRERKTTARAVSRQLPAAGVVFESQRNGKPYSLIVVSDREVDLLVDGARTTHASLKAAAFTLCGYSPSVSGWIFFFGGATRDQVNAQFGPKE